MVIHIRYLQRPNNLRAPDGWHWCIGESSADGPYDAAEDAERAARYARPLALIKIERES